MCTTLDQNIFYLAKLEEEQEIEDNSYQIIYFAC